MFGPSYWAIPGESIPYFAISGNHGLNSTFISNWPESATAAAAGGEYGMYPYPSIDGANAASYPTSYYAFSTGGVRFYMLDAAWGDTNTGTATGGTCGSNCKAYQVDHDAHWTATSPEYTWLQQDLAAHPGGLKLAFFHYPLYTSNATQVSDPYLDNLPGSSGSLEQLLASNGVGLAFNGHAHIYERNVATPGGVTNYVAGNGGAAAEPVSKCGTTDAYAVGWSYSSAKGSACGSATAPGSDAQVYHFLKVTVSGTSVTVTPVNASGGTFDAQTYNFAPDSTPPSAPGSLKATTSSTKNVLTWTAASDNIGVAAYDVYRNGTYLATVAPAVTSYTDKTATSGTGYTYQVAARDLAGNTTRASVNVNGGATDSTPPTAPGNLTATATGPATVALSWQASTDNVGVTGYTVYRGTTAVATVDGSTTSYTDSGLTPGTQYSYTVTAFRRFRQRLPGKQPGGRDHPGGHDAAGRTRHARHHGREQLPGRPVLDSLHRQRGRGRLPRGAERLGHRNRCGHDLYRHHGVGEHQLHLPDRGLRRSGEHRVERHAHGDHPGARDPVLRRLRDGRPVPVDDEFRADGGDRARAHRCLRRGGVQYRVDHVRVQDPARQLHATVGYRVGLRGEPLHVGEPDRVPRQ